MKMNLFGNDDGPAGLAVIPYVKLPSSVPVISNGAVEGGLIVPLALRLNAIASGPVETAFL
jgi:hypothetical protein